LYSPSWNIQSMCTGLISFMTDDENAKETKGIGGIHLSKEKRIKIAKNSKELIKKNNIFNKFFKEYSDILKLPK
jgi:ubiquitin-protein ligase